MALDKYQRSESIQTPGVVSGSGYRAVAESWADVGRTANSFTAEMGKQAREEADLAGASEGEKAVWVDPDTNKPHVVGTLPEGSRPYAVAYRKAAEARYQAELGLSSMTKVAELGNANAGNPEGFRNSWAGYMKGITENVPPEIKSGTDMLLKEIGVKQYYKMQMEDFERTKGEAKVGTFNLVDAFERDSVDTLRTSGLAGGSPEFMQGRIGQTQGLLNDQVRSGVITPEEADARLDDFKFRLVRGMVSGEAIKMAKSGKAADVDKFLDEFKRSPSGMTDDYQRDQISSFARGEVATEMAKAKAEASAAQDAAKKQVKDATDVWWKGENYAVDDQQVMRVAEATGDAGLIADTQAALIARGTMKEFSVLSPQEQEAALAEAYAEPTQTGDTLKLRDKLDVIYKQTLSAVESKDTLQLASSRGVIKADPLDFANPATLQKRASDVAQVDQAMRAESNPLIPAEKDNLIKLFDGSDSNGKIMTYGILKEGLGEDLALRAMRQIGQERPAMALAMSISDDAPQVAQQILSGDLAIQADKTLLGSTEQFPVAFNDHIGMAMQDDDILRNSIYQSSLAVYADMKKRDPNLTPADFNKAVDTVTGGIVEFNGFKTIAPRRGMSEGDFEDLVESLDDAEIRNAAGGKKLVMQNGQEVTADLIHSKGMFNWVADGQYYLKLNIGGSPNGETVFMADDKGKIIEDGLGPIPAELNMKLFVGEN